ncbi:hypothetical protein VTK56DRAFT_3671 [Thermocarpiscus australiensis]
MASTSGLQQSIQPHRNRSRHGIRHHTFASVLVLTTLLLLFTLTTPARAAAISADTPSARPSHPPARYHQYFLIDILPPMPPFDGNLGNDGTGGIQGTGRNRTANATAPSFPGSLYDTPLHAIASGFFVGMAGTVMFWVAMSWLLFYGKFLWGSLRRAVRSYWRP